MAEPIHQFDPKRRTNAQAIVDCVSLGYLNADQKIIDLTVGTKRGFWKRWEPVKLWTNDLDPDAPAILRVDYADTRLGDGEFDVTVFDPPYKLNGTGGSHESDKRFGVARPYRSLDDIVEDHKAGLREAVRITKPGGLVLYKTKNQVTCTRYTKLSTIAETEMWLEHDCVLVDELYVNAYIEQPKNRTKKCPECKGSGERSMVFQVGEAPSMAVSGDCPTCDGSGRVPSEQEHFRSNCSVLQIYRKPKARR